MLHSPPLLLLLLGQNNAQCNCLLATPGNHHAHNFLPTFICNAILSAHNLCPQKENTVAIISLAQLKIKKEITENYLLNTYTTS